MLTVEQIKLNKDRNIDHTDIDEFLKHLELSIECKINELNQKYKEITPEQFPDLYQRQMRENELEESNDAANAVKELGHQLSIIALYKKIESKTSKIIKKQIPSVYSKKLHRFPELRSVLSSSFNIKIENLKGFKSFNELRLLNNSIKHGGEVSKELADSYPIWGVVDSEIKSVSGAYERLLPGVEDYMCDLISQIYTHECGKLKST